MMRSFGHRRARLSIAAGFCLCLAGCGDDTTTPTPVAAGPISLTCSASPTAGVIPLTVSLAVKVTPTPQSLTIQYGDGTASNNPNALHVYTVAGSYNIVVNATSGSQGASCSQTVTATAPPPAPPNRPPAASFRTNPTPPTGPSPLLVSFNGCKTVDPDGDQMTFTYDFGDGDKKSTHFCREDHTYAAGTHTAKMCVTDGQPGHETCRSFLVQAQ
jgi:hypothetical protein